MLRFCTTVFCGLLTYFAAGQDINSALSIKGYVHWLTGHDPNTKQLIPADGRDALAASDSVVIAHVKFIVKEYGEMSFPINVKSSPGAEALRTDLSKCKYVIINYRSNQNVILQLRQTGIHGGKHNHVILPPTNFFKKVTIYLSEFKGGLTSLDLSDVAKFNFAFLSNNEKDGYAELIVTDFQIDSFDP
jgi:hypothetical protein